MILRRLAEELEDNWGAEDPEVRRCLRSGRTLSPPGSGAEKTLELRPVTRI